jgi:hypothetical protein
MYRATERLSDALGDHQVVHFQNTIFVDDEGGFETRFERIAWRVKPQNRNMQITANKVVTGKVTKCNEKGYTS